MGIRRLNAGAALLMIRKPVPLRRINLRPVLMSGTGRIVIFFEILLFQQRGQSLDVVFAHSGF